MGGKKTNEKTHTSSGVEHVDEAGAKTQLLLVASVADKETTVYYV